MPSVSFVDATGKFSGEGRHLYETYRKCLGGWTLDGSHRSMCQCNFDLSSMEEEWRVTWEHSTRASVGRHPGVTLWINGLRSERVEGVRQRGEEPAQKLGVLEEPKAAVWGKKASEGWGRVLGLQAAPCTGRLLYSWCRPELCSFLYLI